MPKSRKIVVTSDLEKFHQKKNVHEIIMSLNAAEAKKETIGDYIISNHKLL